MDVSIAVSLIRGQMGTVVERAVNVAVETVLAEMLKVVGVKFEELKAQVVLMKRDMVALQREKALKEKENDNIRAKLRYTELKLKYYRQGVEEELQQRASALVRIHPPTFTRTQRAEASVSPTEAFPSCSAEKPAEGALRRSSQVPECSSSELTGRRAVRGGCPLDVVSSDSCDLLLSDTLAVNTFAEPLENTTVFFCGSEHTAAQRKDAQEAEWTITWQSHTGGADAAQTTTPVQAPSVGAGQQAAAVSLSPDVSTQADSSILPSSAQEVKQEVQPQPEEEEEVICIKEEPEEEVMATLLLDCQVEQRCTPESQPQSLVRELSRPSATQKNSDPTFNSVEPNIYALPQLSGLLPSAVATPSGVLPRQAVRPWTKDFGFYEEYKLRRNELRRRNLNRRRELEKTLPQPLLADLVRERREKTRLRVARWRAKRKLQACLNQSQVHGGAAGLPQSGFPANNQQHRAPCGSTSSSQQRETSAAPQSNSLLSNIPAILPLVPSSPSLLLHGPNMAPHDHTVTSSSSSYQIRPSPRSVSHTDAQASQ
ncbi:uncharacterized protein si:ch211-67e16.4 [Kryptolebias marmoratus]|uniref:uncharacterized protein si:ch211-67e16.4 n=1 Tax=Kryptolebias marmoratus TaxID=37003 RepID=UPI0007F8C406|nr:uncharacterized protein si:ch211-67e16.4 [Kryptolebias marmoratus]